jgi:hypothetical protein
MPVTPLARPAENLASRRIFTATLIALMRARCQPHHCDFMPHK